MLNSYERNKPGKPSIETGFREIKQRYIPPHKKRQKPKQIIDIHARRSSKEVSICLQKSQREMIRTIESRKSSVKSVCQKKELFSKRAQSVQDNQLNKLDNFILGEISKEMLNSQFFSSNMSNELPNKLKNIDVPLATKENVRRVSIDLNKPSPRNHYSNNEHKIRNTLRKSSATKILDPLQLDLLPQRLRTMNETIKGQRLLITKLINHIDGGDEFKKDVESLLKSYAQNYKLKSKFQFN